ncbi:hypothetical protein NM688_g6924 [Phlebia brevispora]|uniref:Uncharacterized protein n=1 Tax=Phlebia brevispora TaxID=194682 RepID=A0ACC1SAZ4_9APHY|nr:hypothetical protein NM688_g6924 [Phlebia brevispora]
MGQPAEVYTKLMGSYHYGHPLWYPDPISSGEPQLGDIGYLNNGRFHRIFNIMVEKDHPWNRRHGVPDDFVPVRLPEAHIVEEPRYLTPNVFKSCSIKTTKIGVQTSIDNAKLAQIGMSFEFECSNNHGAFLALSRPASRKSILESATLETYIAWNHRGWHTFVTQQRGLKCGPSDLICLSGWVKTSEWTVAACLKDDRGSSCSIQGQITPSATMGCNVSVTESKEMSVIYHSGPDRLGAFSTSMTAEAADQTIFIEFYKVRYRRFVAPKVLRAAAGPDHLPDPYEDTDNSSAASASEDDCDESLDLETVPSRVVPRTPLDDVLDYLLSSCSDADVALTSHGHLYKARFYQQLISSHNVAVKVTSKQTTGKVATLSLGVDLSGKDQTATGALTSKYHEPTCNFHALMLHSPTTDSDGLSSSADTFRTNLRLGGSKDEQPAWSTACEDLDAGPIRSLYKEEHERDYRKGHSEWTDTKGKSGKQYTFAELPGNSIKKRPRRRYDEIERRYRCNFPNCTKAYNTLNHLNAHVMMQKHGPKRNSGGVSIPLSLCLLVLKLMDYSTLFVHLTWRLRAKNQEETDQGHVPHEHMAFVPPPPPHPQDKSMYLTSNCSADVEDSQHPGLIPPAPVNVPNRMAGHTSAYPLRTANPGLAPPRSRLLPSSAEGHVRCSEPAANM